MISSYESQLSQCHGRSVVRKGFNVDFGSCVLEGFFVVGSYVDFTAMDGRSAVVQLK